MKICFFAMRRNECVVIQKNVGTQLVLRLQRLRCLSILFFVARLATCSCIHASKLFTMPRLADTKSEFIKVKRVSTTLILCLYDLFVFI
jgi:hypothetical protein